DVDSDTEALDEPRVFVHLVETGLGQGNRVGEEPAPPTHGEADPPTRSPVERRRRRLERGRQEHRGRAAEAPYGVGGGEPPAPRARIRDEDVGERLIAQDRRPRARQPEPFAVERRAERATGRQPHHGGPQPVRPPDASTREPPSGSRLTARIRFASQHSASAYTAVRTGTPGAHSLTALTTAAASSGRWAPVATTRCARRSAASGSRRGPAGRSAPLPHGFRARAITISRSFLSVRCWNASSRTTAVTPNR